MRIALLMLSTLFAVSACATAPHVDPNYNAYLELVAKQSAAEDAHISGIAAAAQSCSDSRCVENVASVAALAAAAGGQRAAPQTFRAEPGLGKQIALALVGQVAPLASAAVSWRQSDNSARVSMAQFAYLDSVLSAALSGMSTVAGNAQPNITVGGDMVGGNQHVGDWIGRDRVINSGNLGNDNRQGSPGPFDDHSVRGQDEDETDPGGG